jgi:hypothetical protein
MAFQDVTEANESSLGDTRITGPVLVISIDKRVLLETYHSDNVALEFYDVIVPELSVGLAITCDSN